MLIKKKKKKYYKKIKTLGLVLKYSKNPMKKDGTFFFQNQPCIISKILNFRKKIEDILIILIHFNNNNNIKNLNEMGFKQLFVEKNMKNRHFKVI